MQWFSPSELFRYFIVTGVPEFVQHSPIQRLNNAKNQVSNARLSVKGDGTHHGRGV